MSQNNSNNKRIAKNAAFLYLRMIVVTVVSLFTTRIVLQQLGVEDYGLYNVVAGFVSLFSVFITSISSAITRYFNVAIGKKNKNEICSVYNASIRIQVILGVIIFVLLEVIGLWYINYKMVIPVDRLWVANWLFQFSVVTSMLMIVQVPHMSVILSYERLDFFAIVSLLDVILKLIVVYLLILTPNDKLWFYGLWSLLIVVFNNVLYYFYCKKYFNDTIKLKFGIDKALCKRMLSFSVWTFLDPIAYAIRGQGCNMVLNLYFGPLVNAAYGLSNQVAVALDKFAGNFSMAFRPQLIQSYSASDYNRTKRLLFSMSKFSFITQSTIFIAFIFEIENVLNLWLGNDYPDYAIPFTALILVVKNIDSLNTPVTTVVQAIGRIKKYMLYTSITVSTILPITWICLELGMSPISMYVTMVVITILNQCVSVWLLHKYFDSIGILEYCCKVVVPCLVHTIFSIFAMYAVCMLFQPTFGRIIVTGIISILTTSFVAYTITLDSTEKVLVSNAISKIRNKFYGKKN
ncbi:oligosaccharide flippase family protein [Bacteroides acidifaciens]|uniref:oligosaccharide flippase family protein n=1 Tax=Bacteroides acidifaciens TaxID=85831 RepID=UPI002588C72D|nr:oligosaccharide flippase family protein [Bacteroides acidifaciens]